jgi:hypothetical protein
VKTWTGKGKGKNPSGTEGLALCAGAVFCVLALAETARRLFPALAAVFEDHFALFWVVQALWNLFAGFYVAPGHDVLPLNEDMRGHAERRDETLAMLYSRNLAGLKRLKARGVNAMDKRYLDHLEIARFVVFAGVVYATVPVFAADRSAVYAVVVAASGALGKAIFLAFMFRAFLQGTEFAFVRVSLVVDLVLASAMVLLHLRPDEVQSVAEVVLGYCSEELGLSM